MLEVERQSSMFVLSARPHRPTSRMPVDFTAYLLSASPPGPGFLTGPSLRYQGFNKDSQTNVCGNDSSNNNNKPAPLRASADSVVEGDMLNSLSQSFLDYCQVRDRAEAEPGSEEGSTGSRTPRSRPESPRTPTSPGGKGGLKKKVSFADDLGLALENVRIMSESSDTPPRLRPDIFTRLTQGAQAGAMVTPPLVLNFPQPASDYLEFRRRIEVDSVCLENVILKDYNVMGTIKVKNVSFEKTVLVRCTYDNWESISEYQASYVASAVSSSQFDTFSFNISVPTNMKTMQFCINYKTTNNSFWDSNGGSNYEIVTADWKQCHTGSSVSQGEPHYRDDNAIFGLGSDQDWTVYSSWSNRDSSLPYY